MNTLALSMIVKNAARFLPQCLASVRGVVGELVIGDTGSADDTIRIAESFGARVVAIPWNNDFAEARNRCLREVSSPWVLSLDADEVLDPVSAPRLMQLLAAPGVAGYQVTIRNFVLSLKDRIWDKAAMANDCPLPAGKIYPAYVDHQNVRLFRNEAAIRFVGRVHESVGPSLVQQKRAIGAADFLIYHFGLALDPGELARKNRFYRELGRQKLLEMPHDAQAHLELGIVELDNFSDLREAYRLFARACQLNPRLALAWFFQGLVLNRLESYPDALGCFEKSQHLGHRTAALFESKGDARYNLQAFREAAEDYERGLAEEPQNPWLASKAGLALVRSGRHAEGLRRLARAIASHPEVPELHDRLMLACLSLGDLAQASVAMEAKLGKVPDLTAVDFLRAASLCSKAGRSFRARELVERALERFPQDKKLLIARQELSNSLCSQQLTSAKSTF